MTTYYEMLRAVCLTASAIGLIWFGYEMLMGIRRDRLTAE